MLRYSLRDLAWLTLAVALVLGWAVSWRHQSLHGPRLSLESGYANKGLFSAENKRNRSLTLRVFLDRQGGGTGMLEFNPNYQTYDLFGKMVMSTLMGPPRRDVTFQELKPKPSEAAAGQRSFEILGHRLDGRLILVVPRFRSSPCQLLSVDASGNVNDVVLLRHRPALGS